MGASFVVETGLFLLSSLKRHTLLPNVYVGEGAVTVVKFYLKVNFYR